MSRPWKAIAAFAIAAAVLMGAMAMLTAIGIRLDRDAQHAQSRAAQEQRVRLALWRMDATVGTIVAVENARPYFEYAPFYSADRAYTNMFAAFDPGEILVPSPLLTFDSPYVRIHFQYAPDGTISSPNVPESNMRDIAETGYITHEDIERASGVFASMRAFVTQETIQRALTNAGVDRIKNESQLSDQSKEYEQRVKSVQKQISTNQALSNKLVAPDQLGSITRTPTSIPLMKAFWVDDELILARAAPVNGKVYLQGCWLDWPALQIELLQSVADLFPNARIQPVTAGQATDPARQLAAIPVRLDNNDEVHTLNALTPLRIALVAAWVCVLAVIAAIGALIWGTTALAERRATFVSAVTHELRTPLTTFQLYTDMLAEDRVPEESKRMEYFVTLRSEATRLRHLVENVMALARLERGNAKHPTQTIAIADLVDRIRPGVETQCERANMIVEWNGIEVCAAIVEANPEIVEQIIVNLVDNACKYAANAKEKRITIACRQEGGRVTLSVRDYGPNLDPEAARKLFRPFAKSASKAAASAPGVGLGLALSHRLARSQGGDLKWRNEVHPGCCFEFSLPTS